MVKKLLCSGVSLRRSARILNLNKNTIVRKLLYLASQAELELNKSNESYPKAQIVEFDDLETFEHTKLKPLAVTMAVEHKTRRILGFEVSVMPAKGRLSKLSVKKYGYRRDERAQGRKKLFEKMKHLINEDATIKSDMNPHYGACVKRHFPKSTHQVFKGQRGSITGQGELKKVRFDPLFSLNHTYAMARANINRLFRKTWCTTKKPERLKAHLMVYAHFHNMHLI